MLAKLRRRKVVQWGVVYAAGAWGLLQGLAYVSATFDWPRQLQQMATLTLLIGLPIVLVTAWYHGDKGQQRVTAAELVIISLLFLLGGGIFWRYDHASHVVSPAALPAGATAVTSAAHPAVSARSIAVLPFVNMSGDPANEYFSDGISEEILNVLARVPDLSVAARTSSFQFKGEKRDVEQIAAQLKVRMVLEGSVRKQADRVRITAQLIDAQTGFHVWSETYDRELKDIFAIQDEIAKAIGEELKVRVVGAAAAGTSVSGTKNLKAHDLYLRGLALWQVRRDEQLWAAINSFQQAIAADPEFAEAWGGLALCYAVIPDYTVRISDNDAYASAREAAERALVLDPTLAEAYAALGNIENTDLHYETAIALLKRAIALKPSFATAHQWLGTTLMVTGKMRGESRLARARGRARPALADRREQLLVHAHDRRPQCGRDRRLRADARVRARSPSSVCPTSGRRTCWTANSTRHGRITTSGRRTGAKAPTGRLPNSSTRWKAKAIARRSRAGSPRPRTEAGTIRKAGTCFPTGTFRCSSCNSANRNWRSSTSMDRAEARPTSPGPCCCR